MHALAARARGPHPVDQGQVCGLGPLAGSRPAACRSLASPPGGRSSAGTCGAAGRSCSPPPPGVETDDRGALLFSWRSNGDLRLAWIAVRSPGCRACRASLQVVSDKAVMNGQPPGNVPVAPAQPVQPPDVLPPLERDRIRRPAAWLPVAFHETSASRCALPNSREHSAKARARRGFTGQPTGGRLSAGTKFSCPLFKPGEETLSKF